MNDLKFYSKIKNWDFSMIKSFEETLTNWNLYEILNEKANEESKILDLGTGGGEKLLAFFPTCKEILGTDYSIEMVKTANKNLEKSGKKNISFKAMNNLKMDTEDEYFDIVVARHTCTNPKQIYKTLKQNGSLLIQGVDKLDCWSLKLLFNKGQGFNDEKPISQIDYENVINAGFTNVELIPIHIREYFETKEDLLALLLKTPILDEFEINEVNNSLIDKYIEENKSDKGILLIRRYYGITAYKK